MVASDVLLVELIRCVRVGVDAKRTHAADLPVSRRGAYVSIDNRPAAGATAAYLSPRRLARAAPAWGSPSAWDGYLATAVSEAATTSLSSGALEGVPIADWPSLH